MKHAAAALSIALSLAACSAAPPAEVLDALDAQMAVQYHDCVPLGWAPVAVGSSYYPGYTATVANYEEFLDAVWRGRIDDSDLQRRDARDVRTVLDRLVSRGLLDVHRSRGGYNYFLRPAAFAYFYGSSIYGNNHDSLPYLCYSTIVPQQILAMRPIAAPYRLRGANVQWYDVSFSWTAGGTAAWAADPVIRSHSVVLAPVRSPASARVYKLGRLWHITHIADRGPMLPVLANSSAWR
ncbi:MAG TPA: hypothetical protein VFL13_03855 [Candidatus Baltobacteraceae bacterium]|nr:hypothetical protein [Candidatus Baltobacteraceae bacterium]